MNQGRRSSLFGGLLPPHIDFAAATPFTLSSHEARPRSHVDIGRPRAIIFASMPYHWQLLYFVAAGRNKTNSTIK